MVCGVELLLRCRLESLLCSACRAAFLTQADTKNRRARRQLKAPTYSIPGQERCHAPNTPFLTKGIAFTTLLFAGLLGLALPTASLQESGLSKTSRERSGSTKTNEEKRREEKRREEKRREERTNMSLTIPLLPFSLCLR